MTSTTNFNPRLFVHLYQGVNSSADSAPVAKQKPLLEMPDLVQRVIEKIPSCDNIAAVSNVLEQSTGGDRGLKNLEPCLYSLGEFKLLIAHRELAENLTKNLKVANKLGLQSAPIFIEEVQTKNPDIRLLITHEPGNANNSHKSFAQVDNSRGVDIKAKQKFLEEMQALMESGYYNPSLETNPRLLRVNPESGVIFINDWSKLESIDNAGISAKIETIKNYLGA